MTRYYFLPLDSSCLPECGICRGLGCRNHVDRALTSVIRLLHRAKVGEFNGVVFSSSFLQRDDSLDLFSHCQQLNLQAILQIHWPALAIRSSEIRSWCDQGLSLNIVFDGTENPDPLLLENILLKSPASHITLAPGKNASLPQFLASFPPKTLERLYFHFTPYQSGERLLTVKEVKKALEEVKKQIPGLTIRPPLGREVWDPRISAELSLDSDAEASFAYSLDGAKPEISVVIPSFNSGRLLKNVIRHLLWQSLPRTDFEIIVVDDGSTDGSMELLQNFLAPEAGRIQFKYIYFPRTKSRKRGDGNFRAGISRNLGVKHASGKILAFLDSDIIVPANYLENLRKVHNEADVIQSVRLHLKNKKHNELVSYSEIREERDTYILEKSYWGRFFQTKSWEALPYFWKYTCTYSLSVKTDLFKRAGWFRRTFVYYGFEDTDLGYRLSKLGARFLLNPIVTYHLSSSEEDRSEYKQSNFQRQLLLTRTAKVFFLNNLDPAIFSHFANFMRNEKSLGDYFFGDSFHKRYFRRSKADSNALHASKKTTYLA